jgi:hypothetical protein
MFIKKIINNKISNLKTKQDVFQDVDLCMNILSLLRINARKREQIDQQLFYGTKKNIINGYSSK